MTHGEEILILNEFTFHEFAHSRIKSKETSLRLKIYLILDRSIQFSVETSIKNSSQ